MIVLGLNAYGHDAAAVLLVDGEVAFAASEERFDRRRHSAAFPTGAIEAAVRHAGLGLSDVDAVAFPWTRGMARAHKALHVLRGLPATMAYLREPPDERLPSRVGYLRAMRGLEATLRREGIRARVERVPHHLAHAASARLGLPEGEGAVVTADGMGEWTTAATWRATRGGLRRVREAVYPHSPGKAYAAVTQWLGFFPESDEGKTMGLAAYGEPESDGARFGRSLMRPDPRSILRVAVERFGFPWGRSRLYGEAFEARVGGARAPDAPLEDVHRDVAWGIQATVEDVFARTAQELLASTRAPALGLAGGLFLNCALNGHLRRTLDAPVRPFPVAGDAGAAWGAAAHVHAKLSGRAAAPLRTLRLGHAIDAAEARSALGGLGARPDALPTEVARRVAAGRLVALARGRAEFGPRALGGRSLLGSPTSEAARDRMNAHKGREAWRPLAPVVLEEDAALFEDLVPSPWMILTFRATAEGRRRTPGAVHVDGTARVQTVGSGPHADHFLRAVIEDLARRGEPPCVLNTSLNQRGEPIVNTADEALRAARAMDVDDVVLGPYLLELRPFAPSER